MCLLGLLLSLSNRGKYFTQKPMAGFEKTTIYAIKKHLEEASSKTPSASSFHSANTPFRFRMFASAGSAPERLELTNV
jgi:hypothetical protein